MSCGRMRREGSRHRREGGKSWEEQAWIAAGTTTKVSLTAEADRGVGAWF